MARATISFFQISRCGYYERGSDTRAFCNVADLCHDLARWTIEEELDIGDTLTFEPNPELDILPTYFGEIAAAQARHGAVLSTWNRTNVEDDRFGAIQATSRVGSARVRRRGVPTGYIPGYPSYFWLLPEQDMLATVVFHGLLNGHAGLRRFLKGFLATHSCYRRLNGNRVVGYSPTLNSAVRAGVTPKFHTNEFRRNSDIEFIRRNRSGICRVIRKKQLDHTKREDHDALASLAHLLGIRAAEAQARVEKFYFQMDMTPTEQGLTSMLDRVPDDDQVDDTWGDIGFQIAGSGKIHWVRKVVPTRRVELEVSEPRNGLIPAIDILTELRRQSRTLIPGGAP